MAMGQFTKLSVGTRGLVTSSLATGATNAAGPHGATEPTRESPCAGFAKRVAVFVLLALILSGIGHVINTPASRESSEVGELVESLIERPADYIVDTERIAPKLGYVPKAEAGSWVNPDGACSTPIPIGGEGFNPPCRSHDLGYDALRIASRDGSDLGAWARLGLDARLYADLLDTCVDYRCRATATLYFSAVTANSIRQGYRSPTEEPGLPWAGLGFAIVWLAAFPSRARMMTARARTRQLLMGSDRISPQEALPTR